MGRRSIFDDCHDGDGGLDGSGIGDVLTFLNRVVRVPLGDTISELPDAEGRALTVLGFDDNGLLTLIPRDEVGGGDTIIGGDTVIGGDGVSSGGDTMTGDLWISEVTPTLVLNKTGSGSDAAIEGRTNGVLRWRLVLGNQEAESGGNAGSNFELERYADNGTLLGTVMRISRATGATTIAGALHVTGEIVSEEDVTAFLGS